MAERRRQLAHRHEAAVAWAEWRFAPSRTSTAGQSMRVSRAHPRNLGDYAFRPPGGASGQVRKRKNLRNAQPLRLALVKKRIEPLFPAAPCILE